MKKIVFLFILTSVLITSNSQQNTGEYLKSLNGSWAFKTDPNDIGEKQSWFGETVNTSSWDSMTVPGNWDLRNEYSHYVGKAWYRISFSIPDIKKEQVVRLLFEAVYHDSKVWLNGKLLGTSNSGFLPFEFEINKFLNDDKPNSLVVCADNTFRRGAIWNWGGIRRPVTLVVTGPARIVQQMISSQIDLDKKTAAISIKLFVKNTDSNPARLQGEVVLSNKNGFEKIVPFAITVGSGNTAETIVRTTINSKQLHLWNCDDPFLYQSKVRIKNNTRVLHENKTAFGLRKIEVDNKKYTFKLNGQSMRVMGFNLVPDDRTTGNTLPLWRIKEDIDLMKSMGANMARLTHMPMPNEMLDYLDEKGILIFSEIPLWGYDQLVFKNSPVPKEWLSRLVITQFNHPCIIGWSVGNEIGHVPGVNDYVEEATAHVRTLDTTRTAVMVSHSADRTNNDPIKFSDIGLINKYGKGIGMLADKIHDIYPEKLLFYTEYGYNQFTENLDGDLDAKGLMDSIRFKPYLMGASLWTFNDYRSAFYGTKEYSENRPWGIVDVFRQKKKAWYSFQKEYAPVRELKLENIVTAKKSSATIIIKPRQPLDLPAYPLSGYNLVWNISSADGKILTGGFNELPFIKPGDAEMKFPISWDMPENTFKLKVVLLSPLNYSVIDTVVFLQKPIAPKIIYASGVRTLMNDLRENGGGLRVVFEKNSSASFYKLKYGKNELTTETPLTLNNYFDVPKLNYGDNYKLAVIAVNSFGESEPVNIVTVKVETEYSPPLIAYTEAANNGFYVGYPTAEDDYLFQVQYTTKPGDYSDAATLQTTNQGVLFVPGLQNGQTYYCRMRRWKHNTYITPWSEEIAVTPDGGLSPASPILAGVIRQGKEAIICFEPVKKATGYKLEYRDINGGEWKTQTINAAQINHFKLTGLMPKLSYEFRLATLNQNGQSGYSQTVRE
ncbi:sugar-binding domain-containing protein [Terrimonas pollutisoli]|uniref:sugar-binding domain-containing protein n=1 Tax=Terrimonas pollutisoli TaxID=3034147 RepID=UPI0023EC3ABB|nr:sugar-binding domain-containing protein [Terrimonas sp. H1YJ31]